MSNGRRPRDVFIRVPYLGIGRVNYIHIGVGSDVVCSISKAIPEPQMVERTANWFHAFFMS